MRVIQKDTYCAMIKNAPGTKLFQTVWVEDGSTRANVVVGGELSCAFFVSSILKHFDLVASPHVTVSGTLRDMEMCGWRRTDALQEGAVIVWEEGVHAGEPHKHIGFCVDTDTAISNSSHEKVPVEHHIMFNGTRAIEAIYTHEFLS